MEIGKKIIAVIIFIAMVYVAWEINWLFGLLLIVSGVYALVYHDAWERPGIPILWFMGSLICRVALSDILIPVLKSETLIDVVIGVFAFAVVYLFGDSVKGN